MRELREPLKFKLFQVSKYSLSLFGLRTLSCHLSQKYPFIWLSHNLTYNQKDQLSSDYFTVVFSVYLHIKCNLSSLTIFPWNCFVSSIIQCNLKNRISLDGNLHSSSNHSWIKMCKSCSAIFFKSHDKYYLGTVCTVKQRWNFSKITTIIVFTSTISYTSNLE